MVAKLATGWQMATNYSFTNLHSQNFALQYLLLKLTGGDKSYVIHGGFSLHII